MWGETEAPLAARAVAIVGTGASPHHFLAIRSMRDVLVDFFAAYVLSPGLYVSHTDFDDERRLIGRAAERARLQGEALADLAAAIAGSTALRAVEPQV
jgi:FMN reductase